MTMMNRTLTETPLTIDALNRMTEIGFVETLADIY